MHTVSTVCIHGRHQDQWRNQHNKLGKCYIVREIALDFQSRTVNKDMGQCIFHSLGTVFLVLLSLDL